MLHLGISIARCNVHPSFLQAVITVTKPTLVLGSHRPLCKKSEFLFPMGKGHFIAHLLVSRTSTFMLSPQVAPRREEQLYTVSTHLPHSLPLFPLPHGLGSAWTTVEHLACLKVSASRAEQSCQPCGFLCASFRLWGFFFTSLESFLGHGSFLQRLNSFFRSYWFLH